MRLYLKTESDTHQEVAIGGNKSITTTFLCGGKKKQTQALKVTLSYDPETGRTWYEIVGPRHNKWDEHRGITLFDLTRGVVPE